MKLRDRMTGKADSQAAANDDVRLVAPFSCAKNISWDRTYHFWIFVSRILAIKMTQSHRYERTNDPGLGDVFGKIFDYIL